jgi:hypothetical protein
MVPGFGVVEKFNKQGACLKHFPKNDCIHIIQSQLSEIPKSTMQ